jgi:hypothetical protein
MATKGDKDNEGRTCQFRQFMDSGPSDKAPRGGTWWKCIRCGMFEFLPRAMGEAFVAAWRTASDMEKRMCPIPGVGDTWSAILDEGRMATGIVTARHEVGDDRGTYIMDEVVKGVHHFHQFAYFTGQPAKEKLEPEPHYQLVSSTAMEAIVRFLMLHDGKGIPQALPALGPDGRPGVSWAGVIFHVDNKRTPGTPEHAEWKRGRVKCLENIIRNHLVNGMQVPGATYLHNSLVAYLESEGAL